MQSTYKPIGKYIREVKTRNTEGIVSNLLGVNIDKYFMPSVANIVGTDMTKYKVVKKGQFACNRMHVGRDKRLPVALSTSEEDFLVSPAYDVFEIKDENVLNPEYLMMWFSRKEFDRNAWFYTDADVRGGLHWKAFCEMTLHIPSLEKQKEIVAEYNTIVNRIKLNEQLNQKLEETAQAIYKQWFVDFEFPDENGKQYKSSGGEMEYCDKLECEIPRVWSAGTIADIYTLQYGKGNNNPDNGGKYPVYGSNGVIGGFGEYNNEDAPVIGHIGINCGSLVFAYGKHFVTYNGVMCNIKNPMRKFYGYATLQSKDLKSQTRGSSQPFVSYDMLYELPIVIPKDSVIESFCKYANHLYEYSGKVLKEQMFLGQMCSVVLSKMTKAS